jgi:multidrug efflux pump subunit AcrB
MDKELNQKKGFKGFLDWLYIHRLIVILLSVVFLALLVLLFLYINLYVTTKGISFTPRAEEAKLDYVKKFNNKSDIKEINFTYEFTKQKRAVENSSGYYTVKITVDKVTANIEAIKFTLLVHSNWVKDYDFLTQETNFPINVNQETFQDISITYDRGLPKMPLLFVFTKYPSLYFKVEVKLKNIPETKIYYLRDRQIFKSTPTLGFDSNDI